RCRHFSLLGRRHHGMFAGASWSRRCGLARIRGQTYLLAIFGPNDFSHLRFVGVRIERQARQQVPRLLADDDGAILRLELGDQTDMTLLTANFIPRQPEAVSWAEGRVALVTDELFHREDVPPRRVGFVVRTVGFVE